MRVAVVGSGGMIGQELLALWKTDALLPLGFPDFDASNRLFVLETFREIPVDVIINAAGVNNLDFLERRPNSARTVHTQVSANLCEAARRSGALFVQLSCAEVFYRTDMTAPPAKETDLPNPESVYALTKRESERIATEYDNHLIVRLPFLFGQPGLLGGGNLVASLLSAVRRSQEISLLSNLVCSPLWSRDAANAIIALIRNEKRGLIHLAGPDSGTPCEIGEFLLRETGLHRHRIIPVTVEEYGYIAPISRNSSLDATGFHSFALTEPIPNWRESIRAFLQSRQGTKTQR